MSTGFLTTTSSDYQAIFALQQVYKKKRTSFLDFVDSISPTSDICTISSVLEDPDNCNRCTIVHFEHKRVKKILALHGTTEGEYYNLARTDYSFHQFLKTETAHFDLSLFYPRFTSVSALYKLLGYCEKHRRTLESNCLYARTSGFDSNRLEVLVYKPNVGITDYQKNACHVKYILEKIDDQEMRVITIYPS